MKLLTVSIAAYHVEDYLRETLDSFLIPEVTDQLEVLIVNDGSGEGVNEIAREYQTNYPDVFRLIDKENGGPSSARNVGLDIAQGEYVFFFDADDLLEPDALSTMYNTIFEKHSDLEVDLVVNDYHSFNDASGEMVSEMHHEFPGKEYRKIYAFEEVCGKVYINMHAATYRTELLKKMGRRLDEHCFYVDAEYNLYPIPFVKTIAFLEKQVYCYRLGMETQSMNIRNMQKNCAHHEMVLTHLLEFYKEEAERLTPEKKAYVAEGVAKILTSQYKIYLSYPAEAVHKNQIVAWDKRIKKEFPDIYHSVTNRAVKMLRHSGYGLYRLASYLCRKAYGCD